MKPAFTSNIEIGAHSSSSARTRQMSPAFDRALQDGRPILDRAQSARAVPQRGKRSAQQGSALVITLITSALVGTVLCSYLVLIAHRNEITAQDGAYQGRSDE